MINAEGWFIEEYPIIPPEYKYCTKCGASMDRYKRDLIGYSGDGGRELYSWRLECPNRPFIFNNHDEYTLLPKPRNGGFGLEWIRWDGPLPLYAEIGIR